MIAADQNFDAAKHTEETIGQSARAVGIDVSSDGSIRSAISSILDQFKLPPTIVVNAAGITRDNLFLSMSEQEFDDVIRVNLRGTFLMMQRFGEAMVAHEVAQGGSIVNLASIIGKVGNIGQVNYSASKAGVEAMTKSVSKEFGKHGIRVNSVLPGYISTPMTAAVPQKIKDIAIRNCNLRRFGEATEVAEVIAFLASDKSAYVNGTSIEVTGGF